MRAMIKLIYRTITVILFLGLIVYTVYTNNALEREYEANRPTAELEQEVNDIGDFLGQYYTLKQADYDFFRKQDFLVTLSEKVASVYLPDDVFASALPKMSSFHVREIDYDENSNVTDTHTIIYYITKSRDTTKWDSQIMVRVVDSQIDYIKEFGEKKYETKAK